MGKVVRFFLLIFLSATLALFSSLAAECGDNTCSEGENSSGCCRDCGCPQGLACVNNQCSSVICGNAICEYGEMQLTCGWQDCDKDKDLIPDSQDTCLGTPPGATTGSNGCSCSQLQCGTYTCGINTQCATYGTKEYACVAGNCSTAKECGPATVTYHDGASCSLGANGTGTCQQGQCVTGCQNVCTPSQNRCILHDNLPLKYERCELSNTCSRMVQGACVRGQSYCLKEGIEVGCVPCPGPSQGGCTPGNTACQNSSHLSICRQDATTGCWLWNASQQCTQGSVCTQGACASCLLQAPAPDTIPCGQERSYSLCDGPAVQVRGTLCADQSKVCSAGSCQPPQTLLTLSTARVRVQAGGRAEINVSPSATFAGTIRLPGWKPAEYVISDRSVVLLPSLKDVGLREMRVSYAAGDTVLAETKVAVEVTCNPADPIYGQCCIANTTRYKEEGSYCHLPEGDASCASNGECTRLCRPRVQLSCEGDAMYWIDGCGRRGELNRLCSPGTCVMADGEPKCENTEVTCSLDRYECRGGQGYAVSRCTGGAERRELKTTCTDNEECRSSNDGVTCEPRSPCAGSSTPDLCLGSCVSLQSDRLNCGACGTTCGRSERCIQGSCERVDGCAVVCNVKADCGEGWICVNPGDCTESRCERIGVLQQEEAAVIGLAADFVRHGDLTMNYSLRENEFSFIVRNRGALPARNVSFIIDFKRQIVSSSNHLVVEGVAYERLPDEPKVMVGLGELDRTASFRVIVTDKLRVDPSYISFVEIEDLTYERASADEVLDLWSKTKGAVSVGLNSNYDGNATTFRLSLTPQRNLEQVSIPVEIPKCLASSVSELDLDGDYEVLKDDPLIVWQFDAISSPSEISFTVPKEIEEECRAQLKTLALAREIGNPVSPWILILLIPIVAFVLIFFQRFTPQTVRRLSERDFKEIALQQGLSPDEIERQWREYKRRV